MSHFVTSLKAPSVALLALALPRWRKTAPTPALRALSPQAAATLWSRGKQAARAGDAAGCAGPIIEGSPDVLINGKPAAVQGDKTGCGGTIVSGASGVFINGKPMARMGDAAGCGGK